MNSSNPVRPTPPVAMRVLAVLLTCVGAGLSASAASDPSRVAPAPAPSALDRLLEQSDQAAAGDESAEQARSRRTLLLRMVASTPACYVENPTDEQLRQILERYQGLPVGGVLQNGLMQNRFFPNGAWFGNGSVGSSGQARAATLRYSFPSDDVSWRDSGNVLNNAFATQFGAANTDRGRELIRQALASWRRMAGLTYNEVVDTDAAFSTSTSPVGGGDIRIGSSLQGNTGVLAYNFYPSGGGDMSINANQFTGSSLFNSSNNYRYFRNVIAHENGHGLGFAHPVPCNQTKLMEPFASSAFEMTQIDEMRGAQGSYGDRFVGNSAAASAKDFGSLTSPSVRSVIEKNLSTNGASGPNGSNRDWFTFSLGSSQNVTISVVPTGGSYLNAQQTSGCDPATQPTVNASQAGNLNVELRDSAGNTILQQANTAAAGATETITANNLAAGTYTVRVIDAGPNPSANQVVQLYDLTIRVGTSKAPPHVIAGVNKRIAANQTCFFMGDLNTRINESGATLNASSYDWDLDGDGTFETNNVISPTRTYTTPGTVNVTLRVTDSNGMSATDTILVTVGGSIPVLSSVTPNGAQVGTTVPVTLTGINLVGLTAASQVVVSGTGVNASGTPVVSGDGSTVTGLSLAVLATAAAGPRDVTIINADGTGQSATASSGFSVVALPPSNDTCASPTSWGSAVGAQAFSNVAALTGTPQSFAGTGCPDAGPINNDVWYSWTAPATGNLNISTDSVTAGTPSLFNSRVAVYEGATCPPGAPIGCDDFGLAYNVFVIAGRTYLFQVGSTNANFVGSANVILSLTALSGACCEPLGGCTIATLSACTSPNTFAGIGTTCELPGCDQPLGTCCDGAGGCQLTELAFCSGTFTIGGTCSPNPCPQPAGACCAADGACASTTQAECVAGSVWTSGGTCTPNTCPQPTGACCATDGSCTGTTQANCASSWAGTGSSCEPNNCPQPVGACCAVDGSCTSTPEAQCFGAFQGVGAVCSPNPCPQPTGACCSGTACTIVTETACTGVFKGTGTACGESGNPTACCPANFNQAGGISVQDIFDFLAAYFAGGPGSDFNQSGAVSVQDIFDFLAAYFAGCGG